MTAPAGERWIVLHTGARRHYALPTLLAEAGRLARFYTDIHADSPVLRSLLLDRWPRVLRPSRLERLIGRRLPPTLERSLVRSFPLRSLTRIVRGRPPDPYVRGRLLQDGFGAATGLYCLSHLDVPVALAAKQAGLTVAYDQHVNPADVWILREERRRYPDAEGVDPPEWIRADDAYIEEERAMWGVADVILAPSPFVEVSLRSLGAPLGKVVLVPYGISRDWFALSPSPRRGKVLFVGEVGLRKGTHYLAAAARILKDRGVEVEVIAVGPARRHLQRLPLFWGPRYVGPVPRTRIAQHLLSADVFVFPTLCDAFGLAQLEALSCGVPVIATPNCGALVRDGVEGFVIPARDAVTLADRIEVLTQDRSLRDHMSCAARKRAEAFGWDRYGRRLLSALATDHLSRS